MEKAFVQGRRGISSEKSCPECERQAREGAISGVAQEKRMLEDKLVQI